MTVDYTFYHDTYGGYAGQEIMPYLKAAADLIFSAVTVDITGREDILRYAACIQADSSMKKQLKSLRIGDYSESYDEKSSSPAMICPCAYMYLENAGLLYRAAGCR